MPACRDKDIPHCQCNRAIYSHPAGELDTASELCSDAPAYCLQAPMKLDLSEESRVQICYARQSKMIGGLKVVHTGSLKGRIVGRLECERTQLEVSEELGIIQSVISRLWQRFQDDGNVSRCYSTGRPRVTTPNEDRYLAVSAKRNRRSRASDLFRQLSSATGTYSFKTDRVQHIGLYARRPVRCVPLTATHCRLRLTWSREHALWTPQQWACGMFSDESRFSLQSNSRRTLIWRAPGTCYHQQKTIERHRYCGAGWLVWGGIILGSRTDLHVQSVTMTGHIYRDVILEQHVPLLRGAMGAEFLFMDDNARLHRANIVEECLQSEDITRMDWPAYSPDLNPIEHVWDMLGRRIAAYQPPPTCLPELRRALLDEWCNIPQDKIDNLILNMPRHYDGYPREEAPGTRYHRQFTIPSEFSSVYRGCGSLKGGGPSCKGNVRESLVAAVAEWYMYRIVASLVTSSSPVPLKTRRVGQRCMLNLSRAETSSRWCGVVVRRGGASSSVVHVT
ncbi:transposable element Tcb2 transposase [Trichonephila clavipes]|nr:transposable element Tcb2 transposase [Trichonephila clavipes]